ncbi:hypothetical protein COO60DRAFT_745167 [Scenedesmus sp. NREL 46B-D3]|nr:hypothetical protein COO60DRAFT_745167 [Scenedesmus sp. NREL 46B-D3]
MAPAWAAGLTVTTTGLNQQEKQAVKSDVEAAGGRYSPNLSKRTTHLVTSDVVSSLSDKLAAAAAAGGRFNARIVSIGWIAAGSAGKGKAAEVQYAPALPGAQRLLGDPGVAVPARHLPCTVSQPRQLPLHSPAASAVDANCSRVAQLTWNQHHRQVAQLQRKHHGLCISPKWSMTASMACRSTPLHLHMSAWHSSCRSSSSRSSSSCCSQ